MDTAVSKTRYFLTDERHARRVTVSKYRQPYSGEHYRIGRMYTVMNVAGEAHSILAKAMGCNYIVRVKAR